MSSTLRAALVQLTATPDYQANLDKAERMVREAASAGAELVILPEMFPFIGPEDRKVELAEPLDGPLLSRFAALAAELRCWLVAGCVPERTDEPGRVYNTQVVFDDRGQRRGLYRKIHLFDISVAEGAVFQESASVKPGTVPVTVDTPWGRLGLATCYDLRFPELLRALVDEGARLLVLPAAFTLYTGKDHWEVLLRARAIENQCFVLACNQWGVHRHAGRQSFGGSVAIDPWGTVIARAPERERVVVVDLDEIDRIRANLPCLEHRRIGRDGG